MKKITVALVLLVVGFTAFAQTVEYYETTFTDDYAFAYFEISTGTIGSANTKWWTATVIQNGEVVKVITGNDDIPRPSSSRGWTNMFSVNVTDIIPNGSFTVQLESQIQEERIFSFEVISTKQAISTVIEREVEEEEVYF